MKLPVIIGTLLGDAWITKTSRTGKRGVENFSFSFSYCQKNKEFAEWKAKLIGLPYSSHDYKRFDKRTNKYYYNTLIHLTLDKATKEKIYNLFYKPKKEVSIDILHMLNDLAICIWYLDDGSIYYNSNNCHLVLSVDGFSDEGRSLIISFFKEKYNIEFKRHGKSIRITSKKECEKFMNIFGRYIPDCMSYKLLKNRILRYKLEKKIKPRKVIVGKKVSQELKDGTIIIWTSIKEASKKLNITENSIYCNLCGKSRLCSQSKWKYI